MKETMPNTIAATKIAKIYASTKYPIISAYEFEFLKKERIVRELINNCTIYMIVQRPLTYFHNVVLREGIIKFDITDGKCKPISCSVNLVENKICAENEVVEIEVQFFSKEPGVAQPFTNVGGFKIFNEKREFILWWSPQKFLYEVINRTLQADIIGDASEILDFEIHYIGKAFSQKVWNRLTGHEKMQKILTLEGPIGTSQEASAPFEISLILLDIVGIDDAFEIPYLGFSIPDGVKPIIHELDLNDEISLDNFTTEPLVKLGDEILTKEFEAYLIQLFKPDYNETLFENYPNITGGMRSAGYSHTSFIIERLPALLRTKHFEIRPIVND